MDEIARRAGYNKSLLFRYFIDKLFLYKEVLKRADNETKELRARVLGPLLYDENIFNEPNKFKVLIENVIRTNFDFLVNHPHVQNIITWEMADSWRTYKRINSEFSQGENEPFYQVCRKAVETGRLKSDFAPFIQIIISQPICQLYLAYLPLYQLSFPDQDLTSPGAIEKARDFIVNLILSGILNDSTQK